MLEDEFFAADELRPGEVTSFLVEHDAYPKDGPYPTVEENEVYYAAQRGGYGLEDDGVDPGLWDDTDTRDPNEEGAWAEYLEAQGMHLWFSSDESHDLKTMMDRFAAEADRLVKAGKLREWDWCQYVRRQMRPTVQAAWEKAVDLYLHEEMNVVALALVADRLTSATRFDEDEIELRTGQVVWYSHVDRTRLGFVDEFMAMYRDELDDVSEDPGWQQKELRFDNELYNEAKFWAETFEAQYDAHCRRQFGKKLIAKDGKLVDERGVIVDLPGDLVAPEKDGVVYAGTWSGEGDIAYAHAYKAAILDGNGPQNAHSLALKGRLVSEHRWQVSSVEAKGAKIGNAFFTWQQVQKVGLPVKPQQKAGILTQLRALYLKADEALRPQIAAVGQTVKGM